ncbi:MAG: ATP-binding protein [Acidobacteriota bacterium]
MATPTDKVLELIEECAEARLKDPHEGLRLVELAREHCALIEDPRDAESLSLRLDAIEAGCLMGPSPADAERIAKRVLEEAGSSPHHARARIGALIVQGGLLARTDPGEARVVVERGLREHDEAGLDDPRAEATLHYVLGHAAYRSGEMRRALQHFTDAVRVAPEDSLVAAFSHGLLGAMLSMLGDHEGAGQHYALALEGHRRAGSAVGIAAALHNLSENLRVLGRWEDAEKANNDGLALVEGTLTGQPLHDPTQHALALSMQARIHLGLNRPGPALESAVRAHEIIRSRPDRQARVECHAVLAGCRLALGDADGGLREAEAGLAVASESEGQVELNLAHLAMARALCALKRPDETAEHLEAALRHGRALGSTAHLVETLKTAAELYESCGHLEAALRCLHEFHDSHAKTVQVAAESRLERLLLERDLQQSQQRETELEDAGRELEEAVRRRTAELERANQQLRRQVEAIRTLEQERTEVEERLQHAQKLEAVGGLAAGIAHDLNNVLTVILGYCSLMSVDDDREEQEERMAAMVEAAGRASDMTRQLLLFSRQHPSAPKVVDLHELLTDLGLMLGRLVPESVTLDTELGATSPRVEADPIQLEQVLLNLVANARDAVGSTGRIVIRTETGDDASSVIVRVSDDGTGIAAEALPKVLDPFFTTKEPGEGTGLGLPTAFGIVRRHGGELWLESTPGEGTLASFSLPCTDAEPTLKAPRRARAELKRPLVTLLVEDDDEVRSVTGQMLESLGAKVLQATNGRVALEILAERHGTIDVLVTDAVMPTMGGLELLDHARERWPHLKCLLVSGYSPEASRVPPGCDFLAKPITAPKLEEALASLLTTSG